MDRTVSATLALKVQNYLRNAGLAADATDKLTASQERLGAQAKKTSRETDAFTRSAALYERSMQRVGLASGIAFAGMAGVGGSLKILAPTLVATGAAAGALPGILGGIAAQGGVAKLSMLGLSDAVDELFEAKDPFARLSPSATTLVNKIGELKPQLIGLQQGLQERGLTGWAGNLDRIAKVTLPQLEQSAGMLADNWAVAFTAVADAATDPTVIGGLNVMASSTDRFFDGIITQIQPLSRALAQIVVAADPLTRAIGDSVVGAIDRFVQRVEQAKQSGSLADFFEAGAENAEALMSIVGGVTSIVGRVIGQVNQQNSSLISAAQSMDAYLASGRAASDVAGIVDTLTASYEGMASVLGPLGGMVRDSLADPGTAQAISTMFQVLAAGAEAVRLLFDVFQLLPDPIQSTVLAAVALGVVANKTVGGLMALSVGAQNAAARITMLGTASQATGGKMAGLIGAAGKAVTALVALQLAGAVGDSLLPAAADVSALEQELAKFAATGQVTGEMARVFGGDLEGLNKAAASTSGFWAEFGRSAEDIVPGLQALEEATLGGSFTGSVERFAALDTAMSQFAETTNDSAAVTAVWQRVLSASGLDADQLMQLLPQTAAEMTRLQGAAHTGAGSMAALSERTKLLGAELDEAVTAGRDLLGVFAELNGGAINFAEAQIKAEEAVDALAEGLDANGLALNRQKDGFNVNTEKGRENLALTLDLAKAAADAAQKRYDETGSIEQAAGVYDGYINRLRATLAAQGLAPKTIDAIIAKYAEMPASIDAAGNAATDLTGKLNQIPKGTKFVFDGKTLVDGKGNTLELSGSLKNIPPGKTFTFNGKSLVDGTGKAHDLKTAVNSIPPGRNINIKAITGDAAYKIQAIKDSLAGLSGKTITIKARADIPAGMSVGQLMRAQGGVAIPMARGGIRADIYPASNPPLYQFAEPETGGEAFIPKRGDRQRGRQIVSTAASWYDMAVVPMAAGGVTAAASGLVNVAPRTSGAVTRLDFEESYIGAKDAVVRLSQALKENGRHWSLSTKRGRENRSALNASIKAAQESARTKFEETGSVKAANAAYDAHIATLRRTLQQQKVGASTINGLLKSLSRRPTFTAPANSDANIAYAKAAIGAQDSLQDLKDQLSLTLPSTSLASVEGRENLSAIIGFLEAAGGAAQQRFAQTRNSKTATSLYNTYVAALRKALADAGYSQKAITSLISSYGKISLTQNATGGVWGGDGAQALPAGPTLHRWREPGTGGEAFVPRFGDRARSEKILATAAGWYGGQYVRGSAGGGGSVTYETNLNVTPMTANLSMTELQGYQRHLEAKARVGHPS